MTQQLIFLPSFALIVLTIVVWWTMYRRRFSYFRKHKIHPSQVATRSKMNETLPDEANNPSENFKNLFELPVIFYFVTSFYYQTQTSDTVALVLACLFVIGRIQHSYIHCTSNRISRRFKAYAWSSIVLWVYCGYAAVRGFLG